MPEKIKYMYTLSNSHKEYIYTHYPLYKNKLLSIHHPIEMDCKKDKYFDFHSFMSSKRIVHIGWWLRNFKTFIDLKLPSYIQKNILVKADFQEKWNKMSVHYDLHNINILNQVSNEEYEHIFTDSCIFIDLEDAVANNVILECIRFHTPVITKRNPSTIEYLGENYPLFFTKKEELIKFQDSTVFLKALLRAHKYLITMDKTHIHLDTFNTKILYDLNKLSLMNDATLTWFCLIENGSCINTELIHNFINNFLNQTNYLQLKLKFVLKNINNNNNNNTSVIEQTVILLRSIIFNYQTKHPYISYIDIQAGNDYDDFLNICIENTDTNFLTIANIKDTHEKEYSIVCINYLIENPTSDIVYSNFTASTNNTSITSICSYYKKGNTTEEKKKNKNSLDKMLYKKDTLIFKKDLPHILFTTRQFVWRKDMHTVIGYFQNDFGFFLEKCINCHLNVYCATDKMLIHFNN